MGVFSAQVNIRRQASIRTKPLKRAHWETYMQKNTNTPVTVRTAA
jgi:hypothetical protein